eukprot:NODE_2739_length_884_cov_586.630881.p1 GENE.NODE_2739_length_884_cov_586.630881~~NODE_2739_length_884_cov_586.630881.p1  ORF type:complete len:254 (+),score=73.41 NODE_2739_length_884_cov_586.630881:40-762(+)
MAYRTSLEQLCRTATTGAAVEASGTDSRYGTESAGLPPQRGASRVGTDSRCGTESGFLPSQRGASRVERSVERRGGLQGKVDALRAEVTREMEVLRADLQHVLAAGGASVSALANAPNRDSADSNGTLRADGAPATQQTPDLLGMIEALRTDLSRERKESENSRKELSGKLDAIGMSINEEKSERARECLTVHRRVEKEASERLVLSRETRAICSEAIALVHSLKALVPTMRGAAVQDVM